MSKIVKQPQVENEAAKGKPKKNGRTILVLGGIVVGMFAFGFALVPLYQIFCNVTGFNGSSQGRQADSEYIGTVDDNRLITIQFDATINMGMPWDFKPLTKKLEVHPGKAYEVSYVAKNNADKSIVAQAVPGITPWQATKHFNKMECFCFSNQTLAAGETKEMPLRFVVSPSLPEDISTLTLSYTFMNTDRKSNQNTQQSLQMYPGENIAQLGSDPLPLNKNASYGGSIR